MAVFSTGRNLRAQAGDDALGHLALDGEDVGKVAVEVLGPEVQVRAGVDELRRHAHASGGLLHAAFEQMRDAQREADLAHVARVAGAVRHDRRAADDLQVGDLGQIGEDFVLDALGEISVGSSRR